MVDDTLSEYEVGRFRERVKVAPGDACWLWQGVIDTNGRAKHAIKGKTFRASRIAMWIHTGSRVPADVHVCHHCDNEACVRPDHLYFGDYKTNAADKSRRGRVKHKWNTRQWSTLTDADRAVILHRINVLHETTPTIMAALNVSRLTVEAMRVWGVQ